MYKSIETKKVNNSDLILLIYTSEENYEIEVSIGMLKEVIKVSVVDANIPLLLGLDYQTKWGMVMDLGEQIFISEKVLRSFI